MSGDAKKRTVSKQALKVLINRPDVYIPFNIKSQLTRAVTHYNSARTSTRRARPR